MKIPIIEAGANDKRRVIERAGGFVTKSRLCMPFTGEAYGQVTFFTI